MSKNAVLKKKNAEKFGSYAKSTYLCNRNSGTMPDCRENALVAQLVEHLTLNQGVQGSNPCRRTEERELQQCSSLFFIRENQCRPEINQTFHSLWQIRYRLCGEVVSTSWIT